MNNIISEEFAEAQKKMIRDDVQIPTLVQLTRNNVAIVEAMIRNDSAYIKSHKKDAKPTNKYNGPTAYWMSMLQTHILKNKDDFIAPEGDIREYFEKIQKNDFIANEYKNANAVHKDKDKFYKYIIERAVIAVDNENSTHINADSVGREQITERIYKYNKKELLKSLWSRDLKLFQEIERETDVPKTNDRNKVYSARTNTSFASKFCHYACYYLFEGSEQQDNYSINDKILREILPDYLSRYNVNIRLNYDLNQDVKISEFLAKSSSDKIQENNLTISKLFRNNGMVKIEDILNVHKVVSTILNNGSEKLFGKNKKIVEICDRTKINNYLKEIVSFEDKKDKDKNTTKQYIKKFNILIYYSVYMIAVDEIRDKAKRENKNKIISRNGFDHLLWYYHKGRL